MALEYINTFELETTNHCNAKCIFCPREAMTRPKGYLTWETFELVIKKALDLKIKKIVFGGFGEPFLHKDIIKQVSYINQALPDVKVHLVTNGSLVIPPISDALAELVIHELIVSFNGYDKASYEKMMPRLSFDKVMANLKYVVDHHPSLAKIIRFVPTMTKLFGNAEYKKMKQLLMGMGFVEDNFIGVYLCINRAGYLNNPEVDDSHLTFKPENLPFPADEIMCTRHINYLQVTWNGNLKLCYNDINDEALLGNIATTSNEEIDKKIRYFRDPLTKPAVCQRCNDPLLRGGYTHIHK